MHSWCCASALGTHSQARASCCPSTTPAVYALRSLRADHSTSTPHQVRLAPPAHAQYMCAERCQPCKCQPRAVPTLRTAPALAPGVQPPCVPTVGGSCRWSPASTALLPLSSAPQVASSSACAASSTTTRSTVTSCTPCTHTAPRHCRRHCCRHCRRCAADCVLRGWYACTAGDVAPALHACQMLTPYCPAPHPLVYCQQCTADSVLLAWYSTVLQCFLHHSWLRSAARHYYYCHTAALSC
jgi:hypothetical protein